MRGRYEGIGGSAAGGMLYCCVGSDGMIRGCPDQLGRYGEGCLGSGGFQRYRERGVVCEDGGCWGM